MEQSKCHVDMLRELGVSSVEDLFTDIPRDVRIDGLALPDGVPERRLRRELWELLSRNKPASAHPSFIGAGVYRHFIPAVVKSVTTRSEFVTSYTPYQPEISQGMLQALFEYQSFIAELTGMDVVNSSMYDASTALGEAVLMSHRLSPGSVFLLSRSVSPERKKVAETYARGAGIKLVEVGFDGKTGTVDLDDLKRKLTQDVSGFYFETPNFFGVIETQADEIRSLLGERTMVVGANPMALALLRPPGETGADIVIGDAQVFGTPMNLGGPSIGVFGCKAEHVRKMPGRIIGMTRDVGGRTAFCMTLQTREQHIRRSKAASNICTNEALMAVAVAAYLASVGKSGLREIAAQNVSNMKILSSKIGALPGYESPCFEGPHFNEFVAISDNDPSETHSALLLKGIQGGFVLGRDFPELAKGTLYCTTEMHTTADLGLLISALEEIG